ncbi:MAG: hypothetical protein FWG02_07855 [Holophagaceae bacterium]|nr:hypothetical protein [Holophagaceae bacterium]
MWLVRERRKVEDAQLEPNEQYTTKFLSLPRKVATATYRKRCSWCGNAPKLAKLLDKCLKLGRANTVLCPLPESEW